MGLFSRTRIYADAAAATPLHPRVRARMEKASALFGNPSALHKEAVAAKRALDEARSEIARAMGAHADEIIFTGSGTEANNLALLGLLRPLFRERKVRAVSLSIEHPSVLEPLRHLKQYGLELIELPVGEEGIASAKEIAEAITDECMLVSIQYVNSEIGAVQPLRDIAKEVRRIRRERAARGVNAPLYFHTDAAQAPLYLDLFVERLGIDLMTLDAQKIGGPKGVGCLYVKRGVALEPLVFGGGQEKGLRSGTENVVSASGCAEALTLACAGREARTVHVARIRDLLLEEIRRIAPDMTVNGSLSERIPNNLNVSIPGLEGEVAVIALDAFGISASTRSACDIKEEGLSHVLKALGIPSKQAREAVRFTLLPDVREGDVRRIGAALKEVCRLYRKA